MSTQAYGEHIVQEMSVSNKTELRELVTALTPIAKAVKQIPSDAREVVHIYPYGIEVETAALRKVIDVIATLRGMINGNA